MSKQRQLQTRVEQSRLYRLLKGGSTVLDRYHLDAALGFIPAGIGDVISALFSLLYVYFGMAVVKSPALGVALLNNTVRDVLVGLIPFHVGDILDFFHRSNLKNMQLIDGYVAGDPHTVASVKSRVWQSVAVLVVMLAIIVALIWVAVKIVTSISALL